MPYSIYLTAFSFILYITFSFHHNNIDNYKKSEKGFAVTCAKPISLLLEGNLIKKKENKSVKKKSTVFAKIKSFISNDTDAISINKYKVKKGDTLISISQNTGIDISIIIENNPKLKKRKKITVGSILNIPSKNGVYCTVDNSASLKELAAKYDVNLKDITKIDDLDEDGENEVKVFIENPNILFSKKNNSAINDIAYFKNIENRFHTEPIYDSNTNFAFPCVLKGINSPYGLRFHPIHKRQIFHQGVDLKGNIGDPVYSTLPGIVVFAGRKSGYGNLIIVAHKNGYTSRYGHLNYIAVQKGDEVKRKQFIGEIGSTGKSTGPHLHFEVRQYNETLNPVSCLKQERYSKNNKTKKLSKQKVENLIRKISREVNIDEDLILLVAETESGKNQSEVSAAGAVGIMQLMPDTARSLGVNPYNPEDNIRGGAKYLKSLLKDYNGSVELALAAYNAGPYNVKKYGGVPPFKETQNYVRSITTKYNNLYKGDI